MEPPTDYATWSNADLIQRVTALEAQLRVRNQQHREPPTGLPSSPTKKTKKTAKEIDPSRYHTRLIALKFAYLGANYNGFEHHSNNTTPLPTIEEELWKALRKTRLIFPQFSPGQDEEEVCWEGVEYSKCGRTDRGVSAFGQVVGLRVRSARPKREGGRGKAATGGAGRGGVGEEGVPAPAVTGEGTDDPMPDAEATTAVPDPVSAAAGGPQTETAEQPGFDPVRDELPYIQVLNRVLPPDIRVLAWCPDPPHDFSARFSCRERRYRYFFTNPTYVPPPEASVRGKDGKGGERGGPWLDIDAMRAAVVKYEGLHDFRNFCKIDESKQLTTFMRRIFHAGIHEANVDSGDGCPVVGVGRASVAAPRLYYFEVRGSAFLWHQVRHLVAVLFLIGQRYERPEIIDELLDVGKNPGKPLYNMASDTPLVLWDCIFPDGGMTDSADHDKSFAPDVSGYSDDLHWVYVGDEAGMRYPSKQLATGVTDGKHGRNGVMEGLWSMWRKQKMHEVLAWNLMGVVNGQGEPQQALPPEEASARVFEGGELPRSIGKYVPVMQRDRMEPPEVLNARYAARKGLNENLGMGSAADTNE